MRKPMLLLSLMAMLLTGIPDSLAAPMSSTRLAQRASLPDWTGYWRVQNTNRLLDPTQRGPAQPTNPLWRSRPPYKPSFEAEYAARNVRSAEQGAAAEGRQPILGSYTVFCMAGPMRSASNGFQKQFVITPEKTLYVSNGDMRVFHTDGRKFPPPEQMPERPQGWSIGHWEGETLVTETRGIFTGHWFDGTPLNFSRDTVIHERFTRVDAQIIRHDITIVDPETLTQPWSFTRTMERTGATEDPEEWPENRELCFGAGNRLTVAPDGKIEQQLSPPP